MCPTTSAGEPTLYLPEECAGFVGDVLAEAQMGWVAGTGSGDDGIPRETQLSYSIDSVHSYAEVKVDSIGADLRDRLMALYEELVASGSSASLVHLNARDPRCPECYDALRAWGLSFMGCLPGGRDGDYLLLEYLVGDGFDKAAAVTEPNYARMLERLYEINGW